MPEAAEQHRQQQVAVGPQPALAVAAERDVEVVAQPARERHVPAPPEVLQRDGRVRRVEVLREARSRAAARGRSPCRCSRRSRSRSGRRSRRRRRAPRATNAAPGAAKTRSTRRVARWFGDHDLRGRARRGSEERARGLDACAGRAACASCGRSSLARTIGPATRCGKNAWKTANVDDVAGSSSPAIDVDRRTRSPGTCRRRCRPAASRSQATTSPPRCRPS